MNNNTNFLIINGESNKVKRLLNFVEHADVYCKLNEKPTEEMYSYV